MKTINKKFSKKTIFLLLLIILFGVILRSFHLFSPLTELHDFRQTQTASIVWLYDKLGYNLFDYHVPMFGGQYWIHELPVYQSIVFLLSKILGLHDYVGRLVSIGSFIIASLSLYYISSKIFKNTKYSLLSIFVYSILPLNIFYFRSYMIDPFTLSLSITVFALVLHYYPKYDVINVSLIFFLILICSLSKLTILFPFLIPLSYLFIRSFLKEKQTKDYLLFFLVIFYSFITIMLFIIWTHHGNMLNKLSYGLKIEDLKTWYLGTKFLQIDYYIKLFKRISYEFSLLGVIILIFGIISMVINHKKNLYKIVVILWFLNTLLYLLVFNNLNYIHNYYQLPLYSLLTLVVIMGLKAISRVIPLSISASIFLIIMTSSNNFPKSFFFEEDNPYADQIPSISQTVKNCTSDKGKTVFIWPHADPNHPTFLYYSRRLGYNLDFYEIEKIDNILSVDHEIRSLVFFPITDLGYKNIPVFLTNKGIKNEIQCFEKDTLVLRLI